MLTITKEVGWYVSFRCYGKSVEFLVDSGASCTFIDVKVYQECVQRKCATQLEPVLDHFILADGTPLKVLGQVALDFQWGQRYFRQDVVVADLGEEAAILGLDFLEGHDAVIYLAKGEMMLGNTKVTLRKWGQDKGCCKIYAKQTLTIEPCSSSLVTVGVDPELLASVEIRREQMGVVEGPSTGDDDTRLCLANQLVRVKDDKMSINLINVHDQPIKIRKGQCLGKVYPVKSLMRLNTTSGQAEESTVPPSTDGGCDEAVSHPPGHLFNVEDIPSHTRDVIERADELSAEQVSEVCKLILEFPENFKVPDGVNGKCGMEEHGIDVQGATPIKQAYRPIPQVKQDIVDSEVKKNVKR